MVALTRSVHGFYPYRVAGTGLGTGDPTENTTKALLWWQFHPGGRMTQENGFQGDRTVFISRDSRTTGLQLEESRKRALWAASASLKAPGVGAWEVANSKASGALDMVRTTG